MAKIGNQQLVAPELVEGIYNLGVELSLSPCGIRNRGGEETNMICFRNAEREIVEVTHEALTRVESYTRFAAYIYAEIGGRSIGERSILEQPKKGKKEKEVPE